MTIVLDVETSGLNPNTNSIISLGCIDVTTGDEFYMECKPFPGAIVSPQALAVNGFTMDSFTGKIEEKELIKEFAKWMATRTETTAVGQNVSFDIGFVREACYRAKIRINITSRSIDLHTLSWYALKRMGKEPPVSKGRTDLDLNRELEIFGVVSRAEKTHSALEDVRLEYALFKKLLEVDLLPSQPNLNEEH